MSLYQMSRSDDKSVKRYDAYKVIPSQLIEENGFNLRDYSDPEVVQHIERLKESFKNGNYVPPILVRKSDEGIVLVDGHCRTRAALLAIEEGVNIGYLDAIEHKGNDTDRVGAMLVSASGLKLKPLEIAEGYKRLNRVGLSNIEIGKLVGVSSARVEQMLLIAFANSDVKQLIKENQVSTEAAITAIRQFGELAGSKLLEKLKDAASLGKTKVTQKLLHNQIKIPKKIQPALVNTLENLLTKDAVKQVKHLSTLTEMELINQKIEINGVDYLALMKVSLSLQEAKAKEKEKSLKKTEVEN